MLKDAMLVRELKKGYVQCLACEHFCAIAPGESGKCGVRRNLDGTLKLVVYGQAAAAHVDPVEKKPLFHVLPTQSIFSIGTLGCNFFCKFCQNWEISQLRDFSLDDPRIGMHLMPEDIVAACIQRDIPMIAFTYNEPTIVFEYAYDAFRLAHEHGIRTVFVSSGFETMRVLDEIGPYLDAINVDLKAFTEQFYHEYCSTRFAPVKRNIRHIAQETNTWIEVTTLLIPGLNDSDEELRAMAEFLVEVDTDIPWHLSAFHPNYLMLDRPPTPRETLIRAYDIGRQAGLNFVYVGNVFDEKRESTYCPQCGTLLISRQWYQVRLHWKEPGTCRCGYQIPGIWR